MLDAGFLNEDRISGEKCSIHPIRPEGREKESLEENQTRQSDTALDTVAQTYAGKARPSNAGWTPASLSLFGPKGNAQRKQGLCSGGSTPPRSTRN